MTWVRFDDSTSDHPKFSALDDYAPLAGWLWFSATCYCGRYLTDGKVDLVTLRRLWPYRHLSVATAGIGDGEGGTLAEFGEDPTAEDLVKLLVSVRLLDEIEPGVYKVHDYLKYNPSRREVMEARRNARKAGQAGGLASAQARAQARRSHSVEQPIKSPSPSPKTKTKDLNPKDVFSPSSQTPAENQAFAADIAQRLAASMHLDPSQQRPRL